MDSFEINKVLGWLLGTLFGVFSLSLLSGAIFHSEAPEKPGFIIEAPEEGEGGGPVAEEEEEPIAVLLASADAGSGEAIFKRCQACHTGEEGGANKVGPNLWGIVGRPVASHEGFNYSGAMKEFSEGGSVEWDYEHLNHFITAPKSLVPGTAMSFPGLKDPEDRADVIAFLRTLAAEPEPLPEPPAEEAESADSGDQSAAPAEGAEGEAAPADGEAAPADAEDQTEAAPADDEAAPADADAAPANSADPSKVVPADEPAPPADNTAPADSGDQTESAPAEEAAPADDEAAPADAGEQTESAPAESGAQEEETAPAN